VQGWLSFHYWAQVTFAAVPLALIWRDRQPGGALKSALVGILAVGVGFTLAHLLHFIQVAMYLGGLDLALADYVSTARWRSEGPIDGPGGRTRLSLLGVYLTSLVPQERYFGPLFSITLALVGITFVLNGRRFAWGRRPCIEVAWKLEAPSALLALGCAFAASAAWILIMWLAAWWHTHIYPRHFFLFYFVCLLVAVKATRLRISNAAPRSESTAASEVFYPAADPREEPRADK